MIKCRQALGDSECGLDICCWVCDDRKDCKMICNVCEDIDDFTKNGCEDVIDEENLPAEFQTKGAELIAAITDIILQKDKLDAKEKEMRKALQESMEKYGVKKFENDKVSFTYKEATTRSTIDSTKLKKELPDVAEKYSKTSNVSASVVIKVK